MRTSSFAFAGALALVAGALFAMPAAAQGWFGSSPAPAPVPVESAEVGALSLRVDRLEEMVRQLTGEIEVLRHQLSGAPAASAPGPVPAYAALPAAPQPFPATPYPGTPYPAAPYPAAPQALPGAVAGTVPAPVAIPGGPTPLLPAANQNYLPEGATGLGEPPQPLGTLPGTLLRGPDGGLGASEPSGEQYGAALAGLGAPGTEAENAYADAYGRLIAEDMGGAEAAFSDFLRRYPGHELAGNAQYWLAETFYSRGDYRRAAQEFLTGYQSYGSSPKAPDSLLKLGMTLNELGQKADACAALGEIDTRFPQAGSAVRERASAERGRAGC